MKRKSLLFYFVCLVLLILAFSSLFHGCSLKNTPAWKEKVPPPTSSIKVFPGNSSKSEWILHLSYTLAETSECAEGVIARVKYAGRVIRANLLPDYSEVQVALGTSVPRAQDLELTYVTRSNCTLNKLDGEIRTDIASSSSILTRLTRAPAQELVPQDLVSRHSPFIVIRRDQRRNPFTDIPLILSYALDRDIRTGNSLITYTAYFSDEDSVSSLSGTDQQNANYGRRTDIEWVYQVEFDSNMKVVSRRYQGGYLFGIGHRTVEFSGHFLPDSEHPILYDVASHNVFSDSPDWTFDSDSLEGYHFFPSTQLAQNDPREWVQLQNPWVFRMSDLELKREEKLSQPSTEFLYVVADGQASPIELMDQSGKLLQKWKDQRLQESGEAQRSAFSAIPVGVKTLQEISSKSMHGVFRFGKRKPRRFFRISRRNNDYETAEISDQFDCKEEQGSSVCRF